MPVCVSSAPVVRVKVRLRAAPQAQDREEGGADLARPRCKLSAGLCVAGVGFQGPRGLWFPGGQENTVACFGRGQAWGTVLAELGPDAGTNPFATSGIFRPGQSTFSGRRCQRLSWASLASGTPRSRHRRAELAAEPQQAFSGGFLLRSRPELWDERCPPLPLRGSHTTGAQSGPVRFICPAALP